MSPNSEVKNPITLIAAMGLDRTIGLDNQMPWHLPEDLKFFKARTLGKVMIMGKNTFDSIGRPLPGRTTIIVSRSLTQETSPHPDCLIAASIEDAISMAQEKSPEGQEIIIAGGGQIYKQSIDLAHRLVVTQIQKSFNGDTFFPEWTQEEWLMISREDHEQAQEPHLGYSFQEYHRVPEIA